MFERTVKIKRLSMREQCVQTMGGDSQRYGYMVEIETDDGTVFKVSDETFEKMGKPTVDAKIKLVFSMPQFEKCVEKVKKE
jgi:hypothetical protein